MTIDPKTAWASVSLEGPAWTIEHTAHLHRRAGFGASWSRLQEDQRAGMQASLARLWKGDDRTPDGKSLKQYQQIEGAMRATVERRTTMDNLTRWMWFRLTHSPFPLAEKMALVWHDHFATSQAKVRNAYWMFKQAETHRSLWKASASDMHLKMLRDSAMLMWLDGVDNTIDSPNENLAREYFELFALGEGNYSEDDIQEAARILTGWRVRQQDQESKPVFNKLEHDSKTKSLFGEKGAWTDQDLVRLTCNRTDAALHVARVLYRWFISDLESPSDTFLSPLAEAMRVEGDVDVEKGLRLVLNSYIFHKQSTRFRRIASPPEFIAGAVRACEAFKPQPDLNRLASAGAKMGQRLFFPPTVAGWPGGLSWLGGPALLARSEFAQSFARQLPVSNNARLTFDEAQQFAVCLLGRRLKQGSVKQWEASTGLNKHGVIKKLLSSAAANLC